MFLLTLEGPNVQNDSLYCGYDRIRSTCQDPPHECVKQLVVLVGHSMHGFTQYSTFTSCTVLAHSETERDTTGKWESTHSRGRSLYKYYCKWDHGFSVCMYVRDHPVSDVQRGIKILTAAFRYSAFLQIITVAGAFEKFL